MEYLWRPVIREDYSTVGGAPVVDANNFELKLALITMVQQNQFTRHPSKECPHGEVSKDDQYSQCSAPSRSDPIVGFEPIPGCSFNSFCLLFIYLFFFKSVATRILGPTRMPDPN